jgi:prepilin-type N-terminal cleavage/methylation domain-containing protein
MSTRNQRNLRAAGQSGFTMLEAMIAIVILSVGMLSLAAVYAQGILVANMTQMDYIAEKKAEEAVETIFAARDSKILAWTNIRNVTGAGGPNDGVFLPGPQPLLAPGDCGSRTGRRSGNGGRPGHEFNEHDPDDHDHRRDG